MNYRQHPDLIQGPDAKDCNQLSNEQAARYQQQGQVQAKQSLQQTVEQQQVLPASGDNDGGYPLSTVQPVPLMKKKMGIFFAWQVFVIWMAISGTITFICSYGAFRKYYLVRMRASKGPGPAGEKQVPIHFQRQEARSSSRLVSSQDSESHAVESTSDAGHTSTSTRLQHQEQKEICRDAAPPGKKPPLRRTGSGDIIIGEVLLMEPRRRTQGASGEGFTHFSDLVQIELDTRTEPASSQGDPDSAEGVEQSWIKRGKAAGKALAAVALALAWTGVVATLSTYYFLGARLGWTEGSDKLSNFTS